MGAFSMTHAIVILGVLLLLFGANRVVNGMQSLGKSLHAFKKEMNPEQTKAIEDDREQT